MVISARDFAHLESSERKAIQNIKDFLVLARTFRWKVCADIGCGIGFYSIPLAQEFKSSRSVIAVDRSTPALEELDRRIENLELTNIQIRQSVSDRIPIDDSTIDLANLGNVYHEIKGRLNFLKEIYRILRPGGTLLIIDWDPAEDLGIGPPLASRVPTSQVRQDLAFAGFSKVRDHFIFVGHYALSSHKPHLR